MVNVNGRLIRITPLSGCYSLQGKRPGALSSSRAVYTVPGLNMEGKKEVLGLYLSASEGANFCLSVLTDLQNRGIEAMLIASVNGLTGFPEAIQTLFPKTEVPRLHCASDT